MLIAENEPAPVTVDNADASTPLLVTCDHASNVVPQSLAGLGLTDADLKRHIAYDIGALAVSKLIADKLDATLIYSGYSRLVIDLNRHLNDPSSIPEVSENTPIPGNKQLSEAERAHRADELFWPYHHKFTAVLDQYQARGITPIILAVHTFTPTYHGAQRPWHTGVMWHEDDRIAAPFMAALKARGDIEVGDNQPYTAVNPLGYAFDVHARGRALPNLFLEIRQDLVSDDVGVQRWANIVVEALQPIMNNDSMVLHKEDNYALEES